MMRKILISMMLVTLILSGCKKETEATIEIEDKQEEVIQSITEEKKAEEKVQQEVKKPAVQQEIEKPTVQQENTAPTVFQSSKEEGLNKPTQTTQDTTKKEPKKRVDSFSEVVTGPESPFKYGVTKYEWTSNYVALYDDGSKEILSTHTETRYNVNHYKATDDELLPEAEAKALENMEYYEEILRLVNEIRAEAGVAPLSLDTTLCKAATMRTIEMNYSGYYSHTRPNSYSCFSVLDYFGIDAKECGENIAAGQPTPEYVMNSWKNSQGHYENMIRPEYTKIGIGFSNVQLGDYRTYWCQLFTE